MRLARSLKVSVRRLLGWEPKTTVRALYEDTDPTLAGGGPRLLVGYEIEREPEWDEEQVALFLALEQTEEEIGPHGIPMSEATSRLADANNRFEGYHYETRVKVDHAQRALNTAQEQRRTAFPDEDTGSLLWTLVRVEDGPAETEH